MLTIICIIIGSIAFIYFSINYLQGGYSIIKREEISRKMYDVTKINLMSGIKYPAGKELRITEKITYCNNKVKYKTTNIKM